MKALKETVLSKIKPFIEAKRKEIQRSRRSQLDKNQKSKVDESVKKLNELFKTLLGENEVDGPVVTVDKNKPDPNGGFGFLSDCFSIISNKTNSIALYAKTNIAKENDIVSFSIEKNKFNVVTKEVAFEETKWDDLVVAKVRVEGGQVGSDNVLSANYENNEAQTLLHSVAKTIRTRSKEVVEAKRIRVGQEADRETKKLQDAHYKSRLSGIYNCADSGRKYPYTLTQYYDQKEKIYGPSTDVLLADRIRRGKKIDTSFHLTGKPYYEHQDDYEDETPWWRKD